METLVLTAEIIEQAFKADETVSNLISLPVLNLFAGGSFVRTETGWRGEGGFYGNTTALGKVLDFASSQQATLEDR